MGQPREKRQLKTWKDQRQMSLAISLLCRRKRMLCFLGSLPFHPGFDLQEKKKKTKTLRRRERKDWSCKWWVWLEVGARWVREGLAEGMAVEDRISVQRGAGCANSPPSVGVGVGGGLETSLPPLNALGSISVVMSKTKWRGGEWWIPNEQPYRLLGVPAAAPTDSLEQHFPRSVPQSISSLENQGWGREKVPWAKTKNCRNIRLNKVK